uniref:Uncharacterized protein n=1 Tax=Megaselia scalaris TaxID=36166 RepID=T1GQP3_MEGSC
MSGCLGYVKGKEYTAIDPDHEIAIAMSDVRTLNRVGTKQDLKTCFKDTRYTSRHCKRLDGKETTIRMIQSDPGQLQTIDQCTCDESGKQLETLISHRSFKW